MTGSGGALTFFVMTRSLPRRRASGRKLFRLVPAVRLWGVAVLIAGGLLAAPILIQPVLAEAAGDTVAPDGTAGGQLTMLYERLAGAGSEIEARAVEQLIITEWHNSGSPTVDLLLQRGISAMEEREYGLANELFSSVVDLKPDFAEGWNRRATLYYIIDEYEHSLSDISKVLALEPKHFGALSGMGLILQEIGDEATALAAFRAALDVHPYLDNAKNAIDDLIRQVEGRDI